MGLQRDISTPATLDFEALFAALSTSGVVPKLMMIDQLPAFPNEIPEAGWTELRFGYPEGMVTLRKTSTGYSVIVWGTANDGLLHRRDELSEFVARVTGGHATPG
jgi:hypothetical protein